MYPEMRCPFKHATGMLGKIPFHKINKQLVNSKEYHTNLFLFCNNFMLFILISYILNGI